MALQTLLAGAASGLSSTPVRAPKQMASASARTFNVDSGPNHCCEPHWCSSSTCTHVSRKLPWAELKTKCEAGGNEVALSDSFDASSCAGQINFSGRTCVVIGQGQALDAKKAGRFFYGNGAG
jgi:hypothetical protein